MRVSDGGAPRPELSHLARLAMRATRPAGGLRPRSPSMFERASAPLTLPDSTDSPNLAPESRWPEAPSRPDPAPQRGPEGLRGPEGRDDSAVRQVRLRAGDEPDRRPQLEPAGHELAAEPISTGERALLDEADSATVGRRPPTVLDAAHSAPPDRVPGPPDQVAELRSRPAGSRPQSWVDTGPSLSMGERPRPPSPPDSADRRAASRADEWPEQHDARLLTAQVTPRPRVVEAPTPPRATEAPPLPRLRPISPPDQSRAPEITVTIGRIEVLPPRSPEARPPPQPRQPQAQPSRRADGAPELAAYLRERSQR